MLGLLIWHFHQVLGLPNLNVILIPLVSISEGEGAMAFFIAWMLFVYNTLGPTSDITPEKEMTLMIINL